MKQLEHKVVFEPTGRHVFALPGTILLEAAALAGFIIQTPCGGAGRCGKCRVWVIGGNCPPSVNCVSVPGEAEVADGFRLACQARVAGDLVVEIPPASLFEKQQQILVLDSGAPAEIQRAVSAISSGATMRGGSVFCRRFPRTASGLSATPPPWARNGPYCRWPKKSMPLRSPPGCDMSTCRSRRNSRRNSGRPWFFLNRIRGRGDGRSYPGSGAQF